MPKIYATLTTKGQLTLPRSIRDAWRLKAGDRIGFEILGDAEGRIEPQRRRSILEDLDALTISLETPLRQEDIDEAIDADLDAKLSRAGWGRGE
jgi:bifunctional DNA-binding transcriptional regulator/antitoxin component of YhaV-PrlF toxin-antitoxin module